MSLAPPDEQKAGRDASASVSSQGTSPVGSPVSSPRLRAKPGLFHSLKQKIFGGQKVDDTEFEVGRRQFHQLHDALVKIQIQARNYITNLQNTIHSAHHVSDEFYALFNEGGAGAPPHAYVALIGGMNTGHDNLDSDAVLKAYVDKFNTSVLRPLTEELEHHRAIQTRMADRDQVKDDVDYYKTKTEKLQTEHDKRLSSGKDSSKDSEKLTRNVDKLNGVRSDYNELNHTLLVELHRMWNERQHTLGPIVAEFLNMERQFITMYNQAIQDIPGPDTSYQHQPYAYSGSETKHRLSDVPLNGTRTSTDSNHAIEIHPNIQPQQQQQQQLQQQPYQTQVVVTPDAVYQQPLHQPQPSGNYATTNGVEDLMQQQQQQHQQHVDQVNYAQQQANMNGIPQEGHMMEPQHTSQQAAYEMAQQRGRMESQPQHNNDTTQPMTQPADTSTVPHAIVDPHTQAQASYEPAHTTPLEPTEGDHGVPSGLPAPVQYGESGAILQH